MPNILKKLRQSHLEAFSFIESLLTLILISFLTVSLSGTMQGVFQKTQETVFFVTFEQMYLDSQKLALSSRQNVVLKLESERVSNRYQEVEVPHSIRLIQPMELDFQDNGGNSSLAKVQFQTSEGLVTYQLYLGSGRYKKTKS